VTTDGRQIAAEEMKKESAMSYFSINEILGGRSGGKRYFLKCEKGGGEVSQMTRKERDKERKRRKRWDALKGARN
jgi:hypothetical protein